MKIVTVWAIHPHDERLGPQKRRVEALFMLCVEATDYGKAHPFYSTPRTPIRYLGVLVAPSAVYLPSTKQIHPLGSASSLRKQAQDFYDEQQQAALDQLTPTQRALLRQG